MRMAPASRFAAPTLADRRVHFVAIFPAAPSWDWRGFSFPGPMRIALFIDWMNVYKAARDAFGLEDESSARGQIDPYKLGRHALA